MAGWLAIGMRLAESAVMKVAMAHWQGRVSPVFDVAGRLLLFDVEDGREVQRQDLRLSSREASQRVKELVGLGVDVLLCGAISLALEKALTGAGIRVIGFLGGEFENILQAFLGGKLDDGRVRTRTSGPIGKRPRMAAPRIHGRPR